MEEQLESANFNDSLEVKVVDARNRALIADDVDSQVGKMQSKSLKRKNVKRGAQKKPAKSEFTFGAKKTISNAKSGSTHQKLKQRIEKLEQLVYDNLDSTKNASTKRKNPSTKSKTTKSNAITKRKSKSKKSIRREPSIQTKSILKTEGITSLKVETNPNDQIIEREYVETVRDTNFALVKELNEKNSEIERLRNKLNMREMNLGEASTGLGLMHESENRLKAEIDLLKRENQLLEEKNLSLRSQLHSTIHNSKSESYLLLENENLKADIIRLIKMLQNTNEYKDFANYADASRSIHYLKTIGKFSKLDLAERFKDLKNMKCCNQIDLYVDEKALWVPEEAYKFAHSFRLKYDGKLTETLIEHLLFELNKVWNAREKRIIGGIKSKYSSEAGFLRRKIANTPSLQITSLKKEIKRLKKQLSQAYADNRDLHAGRPSRNPKGMDYIKGAMKEAHKFATSKNALEKQNTFYRSVATAYQKIVDDDYLSGKIFREDGVSRANAQTMNVVNKFREDIRGLVNEFDSKQGNLLAKGYTTDNTTINQEREAFLFNLTKKLDMVYSKINNNKTHADVVLTNTKTALISSKY